MSTRFTDIAGSILIPGIIPTGNLLWVDAINGNDSLAVRGRLSVPFKTLTAAKNAAKAGSVFAPGDTIMVLPGTYSEKNLLKNYVNWHFFPGAVVDYTGSLDGGIFDTGANGTNAAANSVVAGYGEFNRSGSGASGYVVNSNANDSNLRIEAKKMYSNNLQCIRVGCSSGALHVNVLESIGAANDVISIEGAASDNFVQTHRIYTSGGNALAVTSGGIHLKAHSIGAGGDIAISVESGSGIIVIDAYEIWSTPSYGVYCNASTAILKIRNARISSAASGTSGRAIHINSAASDKIRLFDCELVAAGDFSIYAQVASTRVHVYAGVCYNKVANGNVTYLGTPVLDSNL